MIVLLSHVYLKSRRFIYSKGFVHAFPFISLSFIIYIITSLLLCSRSLTYFWFLLSFNFVPYVVFVQNKGYLPLDWYLNETYWSLALARLWRHKTSLDVWLHSSCKFQSFTFQALFLYINGHNFVVWAALCQSFIKNLCFGAIDDRNVNKCYMNWLGLEFHEWDSTLVWSSIRKWLLLGSNQQPFFVTIYICQWFY